MKFAFGLVGLLVVVGIIVMMQANTASQVNTVRKQVKPQAEQLSGQGFADSYATEIVEVNGKPKGIKIVRLDPDGPMATYFNGLKVGDEIVEVGPMSIKDGDPDMIIALLKEAGSRGSSLKINRNGQPLELQCKGPMDKFSK